MKYLTFLTALLLSTPTFAQEPPTVVQAQKPVLCAPVDIILKVIEKYNEKLFAHWTDLEGGAVVMMYKGEDSLTVIEAFPTGMSCVISAGKDIEIYNKTMKESLTFNGEDVIYNR